jgi:UDP-2,3-diacylglucosamine pyrophosphatase LpxH
MNNKTCTGEEEKLIFIGDLHGQINKLDALLAQLNFEDNSQRSVIGNTKVVFIGNLIDNAPDVCNDHSGLLTKVKRLVDNGLVYYLMGNHEFNAIGWATKKSKQ